VIITAAKHWWWGALVAVVVLTMAGALREWLERRSGPSRSSRVKLTIDGDALELSGSSKHELETLVDEFVRRHAELQTPQGKHASFPDEHGEEVVEAGTDWLPARGPADWQGVPPHRGTRPPTGRATRFNAWHAVRRTVERTVRDGLVAIAGPSQMRQGGTSTVSVTVSPDPNSADDLRQVLDDYEQVTVLASPVSPVMRVTCTGDDFTVTPMSELDQVVIDNASWIFRVRADSAGRRTLSISVNMRLPEEGGWITREALTYTIDVSVSPLFAIRRFLRSNWQWLLGILLGAAGTITAWIKLVEG
jgi:hypothetical protein